jgi:hypothetical protein
MNGGEIIAEILKKHGVRFLFYPMWWAHIAYICRGGENRDTGYRYTA